MGERLVPADARHLQGLRSMLEDARGLALRASPLQRTTATVLLDGVAERAVHLVAVSRGVKIPPKADFNALVQAVVESLGDAWVPSHLPDVRQLHRARNAAQHEGLPPDRDMLVPWADAVGAFVHGLVDAQFDVDLDRVALWQSVIDDGLRAHLQAASEALESGDAAGSISQSQLALRGAERLWQNLRSMPFGLLSASGPALGMGSTNRRDAELIKLQREARLSTFAGTSAEVAWFTQLTQERSDVVDLDDAERAYAFAVTWVLGFEAARASWTPNRRARASRTARLVRAGDEPAVIDAVLHVEPTRPGVSIRVRIRGVPAEGYGDWAAALNARLRAAAESAGEEWEIADDGTAVVRLDDANTIERQVAVLASALIEVDADVDESRRASADRDAAASQAADDFAAAVSQLQPLPGWVRSAELQSTGRHVPKIFLAIGDDASGERLHRVTRILSGSPHLKGTVCSDEGDYQVELELGPTALADALWAVDPKVTKVLEEVEQAEVDRESAKVGLRERVEAAIRSVAP